MGYATQFKTLPPSDPKDYLKIFGLLFLIVFFFVLFFVVLAIILSVVF